MIIFLLELKFGEYYYTVEINDSEGCQIIRSSVTDNNFIEVEQVPKAYVEIGDTVCAKELSHFEVKVEDVGTIEHWYVYDHTNHRFLTSSDDSIVSVLYVPGETGANSMQRGQFDYSFETEGEHQISVYMVGAVGAVSECRSRLDTVIIVDSLPNVSFDVNIGCALDDTLTLRSTSTSTNEDALQSFYWYLNDELVSQEEIAYQVFEEGGNQNVSLVVEANKCSDTLTKTDVYVNYKPTANYIIDESILEANLPIQFRDESISQTSIDSSFYNFGDGNISYEFDPTHTYDSISVYDIQHIVVTEEGCRDTVLRRTDLHTYLDLPSAFTPNNDGKNDELKLIHKSIRRLDEFKIFNRWGQLVFDGEGDVDAAWDGTINGQPQDSGVYIVMVKGLGAYNTYFEFQRNVTLLR